MNSAGVLAHPAKYSALTKVAYVAAKEAVPSLSLRQLSVLQGILRAARRQLPQPRGELLPAAAAQDEGNGV
jgi:hypothetical protein